MARRKLGSTLSKIVTRNISKMTRSTLRAGNRALVAALKPAAEKRKPPPGAGDWLQGVAMGAAGACNYRLYRPLDLKADEQLPLMVMLHGCAQDAKSFALSTRMNQVAARERFLVLYPEQSPLANAQGCWNWYDTRTGRAYGEAALIDQAVEQVCRLYPVDRARIAIAGLSAGASMAALLATRHPERFKAVIMHSGIPPGVAHSTLSAMGAMNGRGKVRQASDAEPLAVTPAAASTATSWPPLLVIHGGLDGVVASSNGRAAAQAWADAAGARPSVARRVQRGKRYPMTVTDFKRSGLLVASLVEVGSLSHAWSGGAARLRFSDPRGPDASRMAWAFAVKQFRLQAAATGAQKAAKTGVKTGVRTAIKKAATAPRKPARLGA